MTYIFFMNVCIFAAGFFIGHKQNIKGLFFVRLSVMRAHPGESPDVGSSRRIQGKNHDPFFKVIFSRRSIFFFNQDASDLFHLFMFLLCVFFSAQVFSSCWSRIKRIIFVRFAGEVDPSRRIP